MSGTRSPSPRAPVTDALLVAHGQPSDPAPAEAEIAALARAVAPLVPGCRVRGVTLAMPGALDAALQDCATPPVIYPVFMSDGWFTSDLLPRRLNGRAGPVLPSLGQDPALADLAADAIARHAARSNWRVQDVTLVIAAHGSGRSRNPASAARDFARRLQCLIGMREVRIGFVEEAPPIEQAARDAGRRSLCLPLFAAAGGHVQIDIPQALARAGFLGATLRPIGLHPGVPAMIAARISGRMAGDPVPPAPRTRQGPVGRHPVRAAHANADPAFPATE